MNRAELEYVALLIDRFDTCLSRACEGVDPGILRSQLIHSLVPLVCQELRQFNPNFNKDKFIKAIGLENVV